MNRKSVLLFHLLGMLVFSVSAIAMELRVFQIKYADAKELLKMVRVVISDKGKADYNSVDNSIIVNDDAASLRRVEKFIRSHDLPGKRVRIKAFKVGRSELSNLGAPIKWTTRNGQWTAGIVNTRPNGAIADGNAGKILHTSTKASIHKLLVRSGSTATLVTGQTLSADNSKFAYSETFGFIMTGLQVASVQTALSIKPVVTDAGIKLTITPVLNLFSGLVAEQKPIDYAKLVVDVPNRGMALVGPDDPSNTGVVAKIFQGLYSPAWLVGDYLLIKVEILQPKTNQSY